MGGAGQRRSGPYLRTRHRTGPDRPGGRLHPPDAITCAGRVADVFATLGASYEEGAPLFKIVRTDRVELRAHIPAPDAASSRDLTDVAFEIPGRDREGSQV